MMRVKFVLYGSLICVNMPCRRFVMSSVVLMECVGGFATTGVRSRCQGSSPHGVCPQRIRLHSTASCLVVCVTHATGGAASARCPVFSEDCVVWPLRRRRIVWRGSLHSAGCSQRVRAPSMIHRMDEGEAALAHGHCWPHPIAWSVADVCSKYFDECVKPHSSIFGVPW